MDTLRPAPPARDPGTLTRQRDGPRITQGRSEVSDLLDDLDGNVLPGEVAFDLWQTYGFPLDLTVEMAAERGVEVDRAGYDAAREEARKLSRGAGAP